MGGIIGAFEVTLWEAPKTNPVMLAGVSLIERRVPAHRLTETISWTGSGMAVVVAVAITVAGPDIDALGASNAYWVTSGCAIGAFLGRSSGVRLTQPVHEVIADSETLSKARQKTADMLVQGRNARFLADRCDIRTDSDRNSTSDRPMGWSCPTTA